MLCETRDLRKIYRNSHGTAAVDNASICVDAGETVGLFGESGSGKSTLGMMIAGLIPPSSGQILFKGKRIAMRYPKDVRRSIQILFQHPETSFNPQLELIRSITEPYGLYDIPYDYSGMLDYLSGFGIYEEHIYRRPSQLSGGELQRAALARVLLVRPELIILDEPTSMLDVITQVQILNILRRYQAESGAAFIFISHNRTLSDTFCDRLYSVEKGTFRPMEEE
ncbi:MAG: ABC transporter ATP-binding protein [Eubacteriaceae bacterium]|nr:ABC transporter ATP-binding protein [Eubacteriaceae bacterium]